MLTKPTPPTEMLALLEPTMRRGLERHLSAERRIGFRPVETHAEERAAGAAGEAGMGHGKRANETRAAFYPAGAVALPLRATIRK